jgi:hypothetical protein
MDGLHAEDTEVLPCTDDSRTAPVFDIVTPDSTLRVETNDIAEWMDAIREVWPTTPFFSAVTAWRNWHSA